MPAERTRRPQADAWDKEAKRLVKGEMTKRGYSFKTLAAALQAQGDATTESALALRVSRGTFSMGFALKVLRAMGVPAVDISHIALVAGAGVAADES